MEQLARMWINQPDAGKLLHHHHGKNVLAHKQYGTTYTAYFLSGSILSFDISEVYLEEGWKPQENSAPVKAIESALKALKIASEAIEPLTIAQIKLHNINRNTDTIIYEAINLIEETFKDIK